MQSSNIVFKQCVVAHLDDILADSGFKEKHEILELRVMQALQAEGFAVSLTKSVVDVPDVEFLRYIISDRVVSMSMSKVDPMSSWQSPTSFRDVQVFIGCVHVCRRLYWRWSSGGCRHP